MHPRLERRAVLVIPGILRHIAVLYKYLLRIPVLFLARQIIAAFQDENAFAGRCELQRQRAAARAAADDDNVIMIRAHECLVAASADCLGGRSSFAMRPLQPLSVDAPRPGP